MKTYNTRKSAEITGTPERAGTSRVQGNIKKGKPEDGNPFGSLSDEDDDADEEMKEVQDATHVGVSLRDAMEGATSEEKGMYPLFAPSSARGSRLKTPNITNDVNVIQGTQQGETGVSPSTATVNEGRGRNRTKLITTEETTKKAASTRSSGRKGKGSKGGVATEEEGTLATGMMTEATKATEGRKGDNTEGVTLPNEGKEGVDTSGKVPHVTIRPKILGSGHSKNSKSTATNQSTPSSSKKTTFAEQASKLPSKITDKEIKGWTAVVSLVFKVQKGEEPKTIFAKKNGSGTQISSGGGRRFRSGGPSGGTCREGIQVNKDNKEICRCAQVRYENETLLCDRKSQSIQSSATIKWQEHQGVS